MPKIVVKKQIDSDDSKEKDQLNVSRLLSPSATGSRRRSFFSNKHSKKYTQITLFQQVHGATVKLRKGSGLWKSHIPQVSQHYIRRKPKSEEIFEELQSTLKPTKKKKYLLKKFNQIVNRGALKQDKLHASLKIHKRCKSNDISKFKGKDGMTNMVKNLSFLDLRNKELYAYPKNKMHVSKSQLSNYSYEIKRLQDLSQLDVVHNLKMKEIDEEEANRKVLAKISIEKRLSRIDSNSLNSAATKIFKKFKKVAYGKNLAEEWVGSKERLYRYCTSNKFTEKRYQRNINHERGESFGTNQNPFKVYGVDKIRLE